MNKELDRSTMDLEVERGLRIQAEKALQQKDEELKELSAKLHSLNEGLEQTITERARAMERSQMRWRVALDGTGDGVWELGLSDWSAYFSVGFKRLLGFNDDEFPNNYEAWYKRAHPDDLPRIMQIFNDYVAGDIVMHRLEYRVMHRDGSYRWMLDRGMVIELNEKGELQRIIGTHTDIDRVKRAEEELSVTNDRLTTLITNLQNAVLMEDENRRVVLTNPAFCKMFGIDDQPDEMIGRLVEMDLLDTAHIFKEPAEYVARTRELLDARTLCTDEQLETVDDRVLSRTFVPIEHEGEFLGHLWRFIDITARVRSQESLRRQEEKYRRIIANLNLGLAETDLEDRIGFVNNMFCKMSGFDEAELIGKRAQDVLQLGTMSKFLREKNRLRAQGISDAYELEVVDRNGDFRWWLISGAPLHDETGKHHGSIMIYLDITAWKMLEVELRKAKNASDASSVAKERYLAHMSHEIRTPMNAIMGLGRELAQSSLSSEQRQHIEAINTASDSLLDIINDILDTSKIDAGKLDIDHVGFNIEEPFAKLSKVLGHRAREKGIVLVTAIDPEIAPVLMGDPDRIYQVLMNLASNAVKFTDQGTVQLRATKVGGSHPQQTIRIEVADTGRGMHKDFVKHIFKPFTQERARNGGTGLGMTISKRLLDIMGGTIEVESELGKGTTVTISIPFEIGSEVQRRTSQTSAIDTTALHGLNVLLVEDNEMNRLVATTILKRHGIHLAEAHDGAEALEKLTEGNVQMVLMDVHMPVLDGIETTRAMRAGAYAKIPIIGLTANAIKSEMDKCSAAGMNVVLTKPYSEHQLIRAMLELVSSSPAPSNPLVDLSKLRSIAGDDAEFVERMIGIFIDQTPATMQQMTMSLAKKDVKRVGELAHRLRSSIASMGISGSIDLVRTIESMGRDEVFTVELGQYVRTLNEQMTEVVKFLKERDPQQA